MLVMLISRLSLRVLPLIVVLCAVVPAAGGRALHPDEAWEGFGLTICSLPCYAGLTPGRTPFQQTPSLLRQNVPLIQNHMFNTGLVVHFWAETPAYELAGFVRHISGVIDEVHLDSPLPLDHLIAELGMPNCVIPGASTSLRRSTLFWTRGHISIAAVMRGDSFDLNARVPAMWIYPANPPACERDDAVRWRGIVPLDEYARIAEMRLASAAG